jgi:AcrR family transcriptional regulator
MTAHDLLLDGVTEVASRDGYAGLTVQRVLSAASVSRATFYQYFTDVDDCFWSAYRLHAEQLVADIAGATRTSGRRESAVLHVLVDLAISRPEVARLLMTESLAAGPLGLTQRDALVSNLENAMTHPAAEHCAIDVPASILTGTVLRFLAMRLLEGTVHDGLRDEMLEWAGTFARRSSESSWSAKFTPALPGQPSPSLTQGRGNGPGVTPRERILRATAAAIREKGYRALTVADIAAAAGVSRRSFYNEFPNKPAAFVAAYEHGFAQAMAACAPAFFGSHVWPERVWGSALAFTSYFAREPSFAHLGFVECYAIGPGFMPRVHDMQLAFTLFLEEGFRQSPRAQSLPPACSTLIAAAIVELAFQCNRRASGLHMRRMLPLAVYIALTPFIGSDAAGEFITGKLSRLPAPAEGAWPA